MGLLEMLQNLRLRFKLPTSEGLNVVGFEPLSIVGKKCCHGNFLCSHRICWITSIVKKIYETWTN